MKSIRSGRGLGDALYLQSVVRHLVERDGQPLKVACDWPDVFLPLDGKVKVIPFTKANIDIKAHYISRKSSPISTQFHDCCINAGIAEYPELRLDSPQAQGELVDRIKANGKPVVFVPLPRAPMGRTDGFGMELLPDCRIIQRLIDEMKPLATIVQIGKGNPLFEFKGIDIDLANRTLVRELLDVASIASGFIGYCSYLLPLTESLRKPALMVWSRKGLQSREMFIRQVTPKKMIEHAATGYIIDDCGDYELQEALIRFQIQLFGLPPNEVCNF